MVWEKLEHAADHIRQTAGKSLILQCFTEKQISFQTEVPMAETYIGRLQKIISLLMLLLFPFFGYLPHPSVFFGIFCALSLLFACLENKVNRKRAQYDRLDIIVLLFCFLIILNDFFSLSGFEGGGILRTLYLLSAWFAFRPALFVKKWREQLVGAFLLSGSICSAIGILQYFFGKAQMKWLEIARFDMLGGRVCSTFQNPNFLAVYLLVVFGFSLGFAFGTGKKRILGWLALFLSSLCLVFTWTRAAWLGSIVAICFFCLFYNASSLVLLALSPLAILGILPFLPNGVRTRFDSIGNLAESSSRYRLQTWKGVLRLLKSHPWGIGSGETTFHLMYSAFAVSGTESVMHAHNLYLQVAVEYGVVGLTVFLLLFVLLFRRFFAGLMQHSDQNERAAFLGFGAATIALLTMGLFDHLWYQPTLLFPVALAAAGMTVFCSTKQEKTT